MNYIFQKRNHNSYQCGAYSIYNLLVNQNSNRNSNQNSNQNSNRNSNQNRNRQSIKLNDIIRQCKATEENGTLLTNFNETLEQMNIQLHRTHDVTIRTIKEIDKPIIILFHWYEYTKEGCHYALIDEQYKDEYGVYKFRIINYSFDKPIHIITERELKSMLLPYEIKSCKMPTIWY